MSLPSKKSILGLVILIFFCGLIYGEYKFSTSVIDSKKQLDSLKKTQMVLERSVEQKTKQVAVYKKAISQLQQYQLDIPVDEVDFYSNVQQQLNNNNVRSNRIRSARASKGRSAVAIDFEGPYYSVIQTLADWRGMDVVVRVSNMSIRSSGDSMTSGNVTIESVLKGGGE